MTVQLRSLQHVGLTVMNLDRSLQFYEAAFGMVPIERTSVGDSASSSAAGVTKAKLAFFQLGECLVELLEVANPKGRELRPTMSDIGAVHLCFDVDDLQAAYNALLAQGYRFTAPPSEFQTAAMGHFRFTFVLDPDDNPIELYERLAPSA
jgi:catechol 2,3-dioxygenase-like lactoylglutathione lyase family enzyme